MKVQARFVENYKEINEYAEAVEKYGGVEEAANFDHFPVKEKFKSKEFYFDIKDVKKAWLEDDCVLLDFGGEEAWMIEKTDELLNKLNERFE